MTIKKQNKVITKASELLTTFLTLVVYVAVFCVALVGLMWVGVMLGEFVHGIFN